MDHFVTFPTDARYQRPVTSVGGKNVKVCIWLIYPTVLYIQYLIVEFIDNLGFNADVLMTLFPRIKLMTVTAISVIPRWRT